jgi:ribosomal protein L11 methylase PrmA
LYNLNDQLILKVKTMSDETTVEVLEDERPTVSHEDYLELVQMRQSILEIKAQKADVLEFVTVAQQYAAQLQQAQERLNVLNEAVNENTQALQERMKEIIEPLGVSGEFSITDTEPHYIVPSDN